MRIYAHRAMPMKPTFFNSFSNSDASAIPSNKSDKRRVKHSLLLSRIKDSAKPNASGRIKKPSRGTIGRSQQPQRGARNKTRRGKNATFKRFEADLGAALTELNDGDVENIAANRQSQATAPSDLQRSGALAGLKSKTGHHRKLKRVQELEKERFSKNLAVMHSTHATNTSADTPEEDVPAATATEASTLEPHAHTRADRWEALRRHISDAQANG